MAAGDLTDLDTIKAWLGITTATSDAQLSGLITAASAWIGNSLQRTILSADYTHTFQGNGQRFMLLRQAPVTAISSVGWVGVSLSPASLTTLATGYYVDDDARTLRLIGARFPYQLPVQVAYTAGFATPPTDLAQACVELVGEAFKRKDHIGQVSKTLGGQETVAFSQAAKNASITDVLNQYMFRAPL